MIPLTDPLPVGPPGRRAYCLPLWLSPQLQKTKAPHIKPDRSRKVTADENACFSQQWLTNLCKVICFLHFLLSSCFEPCWRVFIDPSDRAGMVRQGSAGDANAWRVCLCYLGLYRQQDSLLVLTLWLWMKILMRGSMYNTAAYALKDRLSGFL